MEDGLVHEKFSIRKMSIVKGLNPYCSGRWSRTLLSLADFEEAGAVLILIVVEDGLVLCSLWLILKKLVLS